MVLVPHHLIKVLHLGNPGLRHFLHLVRVTFRVCFLEEEDFELRKKRDMGRSSRNLYRCLKSIQKFDVGGGLV